MKPNAISLFSGAMGLDLGFEKAGFKIKVCVENDKYACETIRANTNIPVIEDDINNVSSETILKTAGLKKKDVFVVIGGPPCQSFSTAGQRKSLSDFRGNVIINFLRIVKEISPKYFILENVRGILSTPLSYVPSEYKSEYSEILDLKGSVVYFLTNEFKKLGYNTSFSLFNSANFGVPQIRERVIIFGSKTGRIPLPSPTHSETGQETGKKWLCVKEAWKGLRKHHYIDFNTKTKQYLKHLSQGENWTHLPKNLVKKAMGKSYLLPGGKTGFYRRLNFSKPSPTLCTRPTMPATLLAHPKSLRPLSVEEYARIQQFPDKWKFIGDLLSKYKQIGNAVPTGLGYMAGKTIIDFEMKNINWDREKFNKIPYSRYKNCSDFEFYIKFNNQLKKQLST